MDDKVINDYNNKVKQLQKCVITLFPKGCSGVDCVDCILDADNTERNVNTLCCELVQLSGN